MQGKLIRFSNCSHPTLMLGYHKRCPGQSPTPYRFDGSADRTCSSFEVGQENGPGQYRFESACDQDIEFDDVSSYMLVLH